MIRLRFCTLEYTPEGAMTKFPDGSSYGALPHPEMPSYYVVANRLGYGDDLLTYCRHHELAHHLIAEEFGSHSPVIWSLAHGEEPPRMVAAAEEALAMVLQRYATRDASGQPKLGCGQVPAQIKFMGEAMTALSNAIRVQNSAVAAMGSETTRQQQESARASEKAQERSKGAEATSARLTASSRSSESVARPCVPSKELTGAWK
jgi:hypothetical protein